MAPPRLPEVIDSKLVPLAALCHVRLASLEHVRALVRAGILPAPARGGDGAEVVPADYLAPLADAADPEPGPEPWGAHVARGVRRFRDGERRVTRVVADGPARLLEQHLMRMGSAAWGAALAFLMQARGDEAAEWLDRAAVCYRRSLADAEAGSWGRSIGALKARLLAGDRAGARREARWTLELGAAGAASPIAAYAACLAHLVLAEDAAARRLAERLAGVRSFPTATAAALLALGERDRRAYGESVAAVLTTFEERRRHLEDVPVADTVLVLQALAAARGADVPLASPLLPPSPRPKEA